MNISKVGPRFTFYSFIARFAGKMTDKDFKMPSNVKFMSWLPQNDLLAHNKTKLFITHGGMNGKTEFSHIHPVQNLIFTVSFPIYIAIILRTKNGLVFTGLHEAVYQGVPMLCVPLFGDQPRNAQLLKVIQL